MALREYMQDLLRVQSSDNDHHIEENGILKITIIDDNSSSALPDEQNDYDAENGTIGNCSFTKGTRTRIGGGIFSEVVHGDDGEREESRGETTNRIMLDDFRKRRLFLRQTLSPGRSSPRTTTSFPLKLSPSPIITQWTPPAVQNKILDDDSEQLTRGSQRDRMRRLKASLRIQQNSSPLLL